MRRTYQVTGMTCANCVNKVKAAIVQLPEVNSVDVSLDSSRAIIDMSAHIPTTRLKAAVEKAGHYTISEAVNQTTELSNNETVSDISTYKPLIVIFLYITVGVAVKAIYSANYHLVEMMNTFMGGFFLTFSMFKMFNPKGFAESYRLYDVIAKRWFTYGYVYPFIELALGIAYFIHFDLIITNIITLFVMGISSIGVIQSLMRKNKIQCACLGAVFNLPMSTVTLIEDLLMMVMAAMVLIVH
jgi:copper chaperone CopZ